MVYIISCKRLLSTEEGTHRIEIVVTHYDYNWVELLYTVANIRKRVDDYITTYDGGAVGLGIEDVHRPFPELLKRLQDEQIALQAAARRDLFKQGVSSSSFSWEQLDSHTLRMINYQERRRELDELVYLMSTTVPTGSLDPDDRMLAIIEELMSGTYAAS